MQAVQDMSMDLRFKTYGTFLQADCKSSYDRLASLADDILILLHICRYDNEMVLMKSAEEDHDTGNMRTSEQILNNRLNNPTSSPQDTDRTSFMVSYFALVDYITAVVARFAVSGAGHDAWQRRVLAGLAKYSAKLKILVRSPDIYAGRSIESARRYTTERQAMRAFGASHADAENDMARRGQAQGPAMWDWDTGMLPMQRREGGGKSEHAKELEDLIKAKNPAKDFYFSDMAFTFRWTSSILFGLVHQLKASSISGFTVDGFDISTVVYRGGTSDSPLPIYMHQDRDGELQGSSYLNFIKHAYLGFSLVKHAVDGIRADQKGDEKDGSEQAEASTNETYRNFQAEPP